MQPNFNQTSQNTIKLYSWGNPRLSCKKEKSGVQKHGEPRNQVPEEGFESEEGFIKQIIKNYLL